MLYSVAVENIALIDRLELKLHSGLNVLTGETGAGKSIIIDAMNLVLGGRADKELVKTGQDRAFVEAVFTVPEGSVLELKLREKSCSCADGTVKLSRELFKSGRSTCRIDGKSVALAALKEVSELLVDVHGQHEHQSLLRVSMHRGFLDAFGGREVEMLKERCRAESVEYKKIVRRLEEGFGDAELRELKRDRAAFAIDEITRANLRVGEEAELKARRGELRSAGDINGAIERAYAALYHGRDGGASVLDAAGGAAGELDSVLEVYPRLKPVKERLDDAYYRMEDVVIELRSMRGEVEFDPNALERIEARLETIERVCRKYGGDEAKALATLEELGEQVYELEHSEELAAKLEERKAELYESWKDAASLLSDARYVAAEQLEERLLEQLQELGMQGASLRVSLEGGEEDASVSGDGWDDVEFLISANRGEPLRPLARVASGGELSRVMLAIKTVEADKDMIPTVVFDEIDTGISGRTAQVVAEKLRGIAGTRQVLCVTHLPQIAAMADAHLLVTKSDDGLTTRTNIEALDENSRVGEIARLAGGSERSESALGHARDMIAQARRRQ